MLQALKTVRQAFRSEKAANEMNYTRLRLRAEEASMYTPDMHELRMYKTVLLFVCDEHMRGNTKSGEFQEHCRFLISGFTAPRFVLWRKTATGEAIPLRGKEGDTYAPPARIRGEIYQVPTDYLVWLDKAKENTVVYKRKLVKIHIPYRIVERQLVWSRAELSHAFQKQRALRLVSEKMEHVEEVYMYIGVEDFWNDQLDGGYLCKPVKRFTPSSDLKNPYYQFTPTEQSVI